MFRKIAVLLIIFLLGACNLSASSGGTSIFPFLKICPSARDSGMGEMVSFSASGSPQSNPAVLPWSEQNEISLNHIIYFQETNYSYLNYNHLFKDSMAFNASLGYVGIGGLTKTVADSSFEGFSESGNFDYYDMLGSIGFGHRISRNFSYGVTARYVQEKIDTSSNSGAMMSFGGYFCDLPQEWEIGFGVFNLGPKVKEFELPGGAYAGVGRYFLPNIFAGVEVVSYLDSVSEAKAGMEFILTKAVTLRAGYRHPFDSNKLGDFPLVNVTAGLGFNFGEFTFDYAWVPYGDLGQTHRFGLLKKFGSKHIRKKRITEKKEKQKLKQKAKEVIKASKDKENIAVYDLKTENVPSYIVKVASNLLRLEIIDSGVFNVVDRENIEKITSEYQTQLSGLTDQEQTVQTGKLLNARYIITGSIEDVDGQYFVLANMIDVESGKIIKSMAEKSENIDNIRQACKNIAWKMKE
ncbi:MAG: PorV/PorQ family protein [Elusimicrobia bacterium]|nr:PorV/PorQ family protein [Elusimicrobiota bacterium]